MKRLNRIVVLGFTSVLTFWIGLLVIVAVLDERLVFQNMPPSYEDNDSILKIKMNDSRQLSAKFYRNANAEYTLLYSHGSGVDLGNMEYISLELQRKGFNLIVYDYPGYGTSDGSTTETGCYEAIIAVYSYLTEIEQIPPERIIAYGRSVGSGPSIYLASHKNLGGLIVASGFVSSFRVATKFPIIPWDKFPNSNRIANVTCPILIIHGRQDKIVPHWHGLSLYEKTTSKQKKMLTLAKAGHHDIQDFQEYWDEMEQFTKILLHRSF